MKTAGTEGVNTVNLPDKKPQPKPSMKPVAKLVVDAILKESHNKKHDSYRKELGVFLHDALGRLENIPEVFGGPDSGTK